MKNLFYAILVIIFAIVTIDMGVNTILALLDLRIVAALFGALLTKACYKAM